MALSGSSAIEFRPSDPQPKGFYSVPFSPTVSFVAIWEEGTGAASGANGATAEAVGLVEHTLTGGSDTIDLDADATDLDGNAIAFTGLKDVTVEAPDGNAGPVTLSFDDAAGWDAGIVGDVILKPGSCLKLLTRNATAYAVGAAASDEIVVTGTAGDTLKIGLVGEVS